MTTKRRPKYAADYLKHRPFILGAANPYYQPKPAPKTPRRAVSRADVQDIFSEMIRAEHWATVESTIDPKYLSRHGRWRRAVSA